MWLIRLVQSIEYGGRRCLLKETSSHHPCRSRPLLLMSFSLSLGFNKVSVIPLLSWSPWVGGVPFAYFSLFRLDAFTFGLGSSVFGSLIVLILNRNLLKYIYDKK